MRRRLLVSTVGVTVAVLLLLALPILIVLRDAAQQEEVRRLEEEAQRVALVLSPTLDRGELPERSRLVALTPLSASMTVVLPDGQSAETGDDLSGTTVRGDARTAGGAVVVVQAEARPFDERLSGDIVSMGSLVLVGVAAAAVLSVIQARRLARPFEQLATAARRFGNGDFSTVMPVESGIEELDNIGRALASSATRLEQMFAAERSFTGDATHQLRTGLTGISLRLEMIGLSDDPAARAEARAALQQTDQLNGTIDELLALARRGRAEHRIPFDLRTLIVEHVLDWQAAFAAQGRTIDVTPARSMVVGTPGFAGQVIDVLLSNSLVHGAGTTRVELLPRGVEVSDDGRGIPHDLVGGLFAQQTDPGAAHGRGLPLARRLSEADGGTLELVDGRRARFRYLLHGTDESFVGDDEPATAAALTA